MTDRVYKTPLTLATGRPGRTFHYIWSETTLSWVFAVFLNCWVWLTRRIYELVSWKTSVGRDSRGWVADRRVSNTNPIREPGCYLNPVFNCELRTKHQLWFLPLEFSIFLKLYIRRFSSWLNDGVTPLEFHLCTPTVTWSHISNVAVANSNVTRIITPQG